MLVSGNYFSEAGLGDLCMDDSFYLTFLRARKFNVEKTVKLVRTT